MFWFITTATLITVLCTQSVRTQMSARGPPGPFESVKGDYKDFESQVVDLHIQYCFTSCDSRFPQHHADGKPKKCAPCFCDEECYLYNDCCPDKQIFKPKPNISPLTNTGCYAVSFQLYNEDSDKHLKLINSCPSTYKNEFIKEMCLKTDSLHWKYIKPYSDLTTKLSYRNRYCAQCNGIPDPLTWDIQISCTSYKDYGDTSNVTEIYFNVISSPNCHITFAPPNSNITTRACSLEKEPMYTKCNQTGSWLFYDNQVEQACGLYTNVIFGKYRNLFCRLCNERVFWDDLMSEPQSHITFTKFGMTSLLDLRDDNEQDNFLDSKVVALSNSPVMSDVSASSSSCSQNEVLNPLTCDCDQKLCYDGEILNNGECQSIYLQTNSFGYSICILINGTYNSTYYRNFENFARSVPRWSQDLDINTEMKIIPLSVLNCNDGLAQITAKISINVIFQRPINMDSKQKQLLNKVSNFGAVLSTHGGYIQSSIYAECITPSFSVSAFEIGSTCTRTNAGVVEASIPLPNEVLPVLPNIEFLQLNKLMSCVQMVVNSTQFLRSEYYLTILLNNVVLTTGEYKLSGDSDVVVCVEDYFKDTSMEACEQKFFQNGVTNNTIKDEGVNPLGVTSVVCTCISLVFLIITFGFYCAVKYMRNAVGVNVMGLVVTLFIAQTVYEFGLELVDYTDLCKAMAIFIHYFWLSSVFWMNACTVVLFLKLCFPLQTRGFTTKYVFMRSLLHSTLCPLIIVCINIIVNYTTSDDIGYGNKYICYITSITQRRFAFALPLGILILINIILFAYTFIKLRVDTIDSAINRENKINILACLKLSVITGAAWIFAFIYEATRAIVFAYFFTILVGAQGVVIFVTFVANKRVCIACKEKIQTSTGMSHSSSNSKQKKYLVPVSAESPLPSISRARRINTDGSESPSAVKLRPSTPTQSEETV